MPRRCSSRRDIRVSDSSRDRDADADHLSIEQRQLRVDAGHRAFARDGALDPDWDALGEDDVEDLVLEAVFREGRGDGPFDGALYSGRESVSFVDISRRTTWFCGTARARAYASPICTDASLLLLITTSTFSPDCAAAGRHERADAQR